nr:amidase family protein [Luteimicrobium subarcticum]
MFRVEGSPLVAPTGRGPLDGLGVAVKDLFDVAGHRVGAGVPAWLDAAAPADRHAPAVADLLAAGAHVVGIAHTDELAYSVAGANPHHGTPPNPAAPWAVPGGSSSGPASAVASGAADVGLATDTAGSVRVPASYQGLWGLRTTHDAVDRTGLVPLAPSFDTVGWITRDAGTLLAVASAVLAGAAPATAPPPAAGPDDDPSVTLAWSPALLAHVEPTTRAAFTALLARWAALPGVRVRALADDALPDPADAFAAFRTVQAAEAWRSHGSFVDAHADALGTAVARRFAAARRVTPDEEAAARAEADRVARAVRAVLADAVLVLPTTPGPAPRRATPEVEEVRVPTLELTCLAALAGAPALSVPVLVVTVPEAGPAPVGVSLVGRPGDDLALVRLGARLDSRAATTGASNPRNLAATTPPYAANASRTTTSEHRGAS